MNTRSSDRESHYWRIQSQRLYLLHLIAFYLVTAQVLADTLVVEAFTDSARFPIQPLDRMDSRQDVTVTIYNLAAPKHLEQTLSAGLPKDPAVAITIAKQRLQEHKHALSQRLLTAYEPHTKAMTYALTQYPALVFNGETVMVGVTDIHEALKRYQQWLETTR